MFGGKIGLPELLILLVIFLLVLPIFILGVVAWFRIFRKAGISPWLGIAMLVPMVNLCLLFWFAFSTWPIELELARLRAALQAGSGSAPVA